MKSKIVLLVSLLFIFNVYQCGRGSVAVLKTDKEKMGYAFGAMQGTQLGKSFPKFEQVLGASNFADGAFDMLKNGKCKFDEKKLREILAGFQKKMKANQKKPSSLKFENKTDVSYMLGCLQTQRFRKVIGGHVSEKALAQGYEDGLKDNNLLMQQAEMQTFMEKLKKLVSAPKKAQSPEDKKVLQEGEKFLAKKSKQAGIQSIPSGVLYKVLKKGYGKKPSITDSVTVHYKGTLVNGKEFDSSYKRGKPASFGLRGVIRGWTDILQMMPTGSKWQVYIPQHLAYGSNSKSNIPAYSALIFDIELIKINPPQTRKLPQTQKKK